MDKISIEEKFRYEIQPLLNKGELEQAEKKLRRLMLGLTDRNTTEEHRLIIFILAKIKYIQGDIDNAKYYMERFEKKLNQDSNYKNEYKMGYSYYINLKVELYKDELSYEEKYRLYSENLKIGKERNDLCTIIITKFDLAHLDGDVDEIENILIDIHSYKYKRNLSEEDLEAIEYAKRGINKELYLHYPDLAEEYLGIQAN